MEKLHCNYQILIMDITEQNYLAKNVSKVVEFDYYSVLRQVTYMQYNDLSSIAGTDDFNLQLNQRIYFANDLVEEPGKELDHQLIEAATEIDIYSADDELIRAIFQVDHKINSKFLCKSTHIFAHPKYKYVIEDNLSRSNLLDNKHIVFNSNMEEDTILVTCIDNDKNLFPAILLSTDNQAFLDIVNPELLFKIVIMETIE